MVVLYNTISARYISYCACTKDAMRTIFYLRGGRNYVTSEKILTFSGDVTAAMLVYRTILKNVFWEFDSTTMQNLGDILPLFCTPTWPSHHVSENQELYQARISERCLKNLRKKPVIIYKYRVFSLT